jgi:hypothetical protein
MFGNRVDCSEKIGVQDYAIKSYRRKEVFIERDSNVMIEEGMKLLSKHIL